MAQCPTTATRNAGHARDSPHLPRQSPATVPHACHAKPTHKCTISHACNADTVTPATQIQCPGHRAAPTCIRTPRACQTTRLHPCSALPSSMVPDCRAKRPRPIRSRVDIAKIPHACHTEPRPTTSTETLSSQIPMEERCEYATRTRSLTNTRDLAPTRAHARPLSTAVVFPTPLEMHLAWHLVERQWRLLPMLAQAVSRHPTSTPVIADAVALSFMGFMSDANRSRKNCVTSACCVFFALPHWLTRTARLAGRRRPSCRRETHRLAPCSRWACQGRQTTILEQGANLNYGMQDP